MSNKTEQKIMFHLVYRPNNSGINSKYINFVGFTGL